MDYQLLIISIMIIITTLLGIPFLWKPSDSIIIDDRFKNEESYYFKMYSESVKEIDSLKIELNKLPHLRQYILNNKEYILEPIIKENDIKMNDINDIFKSIEIVKYKETIFDQTNIIKKWNKNTYKLQDFSSQIQRSNKIVFKSHDNDNDDDDILCNELYITFIKCRKILDEQSKRLNQIGTHHHILRLLHNQNKLSKQIKENIKEETLNIDKNNELNKEYQDIYLQRNEMKKLIKNNIFEYNKLVQKENDLLKKKVINNKFKDLLKNQDLKLESISDESKSLINSYKIFEENNKEYIQEIDSYFFKTWKLFESTWWKWTDKDIISWFKYKTRKRNTNMINWLNVFEEIKKRNINGLSLQYFNDLTMDLIKIYDFNIATYLMDQIQKLQQKYLNKDKIINKNENEESKYFCPLSQQLMVDPVIAFDANVYEREFIVKYLKEKGLSPITNETAYTLHVFSYNQLREEIKNSPLYQQHMTTIKTWSHHQHFTKNKIYDFKM